MLDSALYDMKNYAGLGGGGGGGGGGEGKGRGGRIRKQNPIIAE